MAQTKKKVPDPPRAAILWGWPQPPVRARAQTIRRIQIYPGPYQYTYAGLGSPSTEGSSAAPPSGGTNPLQYAQTAATVAAAYTSGQDPRMMRATYLARIENFKVMRQKMPLLRTYYDNQINLLQSKVAALDEKLALQVEGEAATKDWRSLGQTGIGVGVVAGVALTALLLVTAYKVGSSRRL